MRWLLPIAAVVLVTACGGGGRPPSPPSPPSGRDRAVADAERLIAISQRLDYRDPAARTRTMAQAQALARYEEACQLGDPRACWRRLVVPDSGDADTTSRLILAIAEHCRGGDTMSCRFLWDAGDKLWPDNDAAGLCRQGIATACHVAGRSINGTHAHDPNAMDEAGCDLGDGWACLALLRRGAPSRDAARAAVLHERARAAAAAECRRGYAVACSWFDPVRGGELDPVDGFPELAIANATDGCRLGELDDCKLLSEIGASPAVRDGALAADCATKGDGCDELAKGRLPGSPGERDALEHGCQWFRRDLCVALVRGYRVGRWPEPVPGRAKTLTSWMCAGDDAAPRDCAQLDAAPRAGG